MEKISLQADGLELSINTKMYENVSKLEILEAARDSISKCIKEEKEKKEKSPIWEELECVSGCYISTESKIFGQGSSNATEENQNIFYDEQCAKSALALAKISQLMPRYGGKITDEEWCNTSITKYTIIKEDGKLRPHCAYACYEFIAFRTREYREKFFSREKNVRLVKDYYMMD